MKIARATALLICLTSASWMAYAQTPVRDGKWEITTEMDMPGMPMKMPALKSTQCITKEQAADPNASVPKGPQDKNSDCKVSDYKTVGNKVTWTLTCTGKRPMTGTGELTYGTDSYEGWFKMKTGGTEMTTKYTAKRLGDCTK